jgi:hypothetical protein
MNFAKKIDFQKCNIFLCFVKEIFTISLFPLHSETTFYTKLTDIIVDSNLILIFGFGLATFLVGFIITPYYIDLLNYLKLGKQIRENATLGKAFEFFKLHKDKV